VLDGGHRSQLFYVEGQLRLTGVVLVNGQASTSTTETGEDRLVGAMGGAIEAQGSEVSQSGAGVYVYLSGSVIANCTAVSTENSQDVRAPSRPLQYRARIPQPRHMLCPVLMLPHTRLTPLEPWLLLHVYSPYTT
jgi:hypothetical protein